MTGSNLQNVTKAITLVKNYSNQVIEASVIEYVCGKIGKQFAYQDELAVLKDKEDRNLLTLLENIDFSVDIEYEFINDYGMKVKRIKTFFPFFSRHFYCPAELGNYLRKASEKFSWLEKWFKDIKKQGLTYKRKVTYPDGVLPFVYSLK